MTIFTILGLVWVALMSARAPTLIRECRVFVTCFKRCAGYTTLQARWVTFRWVFLPGTLMAPALVVLDLRTFLDPPSAQDIYDAAKLIDEKLRPRVQPTSKGTQQ